MTSEPAATAERPSAGSHLSQTVPYGNGINGGLGEDKEADKLQQAVAAWRAVEFSKRLSALDRRASDVVAQQKDTLTQRKDVATRTKDFRRLDDVKKLSEIRALLKSYQSFIDLLTDHNKSASSAFFDLYSSFSDVPDPYPLLEASLDSLVVAETTVPRITAENHELQRTVRTLTEQLERAERRLVRDVEKRAGEESAQAERVRQLESSWETLMREKADDWDVRERAYLEKLEKQERLSNELRANYEVAQRLGEGGGEANNDAQSTVVQAEMDMMNVELARATTRLAEVEARNYNLQRELARTISDAQKPTPTPVEDDPAFIRLQTENSSLMRRVNSMRVERESDRGVSEVKSRSSQREVEQLLDEKKRLLAKLKSVEDYDDVKRELNILRAIEFSVTDDPEGSNLAPFESQPLEKLLHTRNKKLLDDLILLRTTNQESNSKLEALQDDMSTATAELENSRSLCTSLENDLLRLQREYAVSSPAEILPAQPQQGSLRAASKRHAIPRPPSPIATPNITSRTSTDSLRTLSLSQTGTLGGSSSSAQSILPLVTSQRDRFRARNQQLESELKANQLSISTLRNEVNALQADNLRLFEKSRYISSYTQSRSTSAIQDPTQISQHATDDYSPVPGILSSNTPSSNGSALNPFTSFRNRESTRAYRRMRLPERLVYNLSKLVTSTRSSRNLFAIYLFTLHALILFMLFGGASVTSRVDGPDSMQARSPVRAAYGKDVAALAGKKPGIFVDDDGQWVQESGPD